MTSHWLTIALLAVSPGAPPDASSSDAAPAAVKADLQERTTTQLRIALRDALRGQAAATGSHQEAAVRKLAELHREVTANTQLPAAEKLELRTRIRSRLTRVSDALKQKLADDDQPPAQPGDPNRSPANAPVAGALLAQQRPKPPAAPRQRAAAAKAARPSAAGAQANGADAWAAMTTQNAEQLIDLIQSTIAPSSWDVNGGLGSIRYFEPRQVLVIRQRGDIHDQIGEAIGALRGK